MAKLKLNVDALQVQSFATMRDGAGSLGTVEGHSGRTPSLTRQNSCPGYPCETYAETCPETCNWTCAGDSCDYTCPTNLCACNQSDFGTCIC
jgi:hypothetical protein